MTNDSDKIYRLYVEHDETNMANPEEKREVQIGKKILAICKQAAESGNRFEKEGGELEKLAKELIEMHGQEIEPDDKWSAKEEVGGDEDCEMQNTGPGQV